MKQPNDKPRKKKNFLILPSYPGGKQAFLKFIAENLRYPQAALENKIEGTVYLEYTVDNLGVVGDETLIHGIGYGCDEEALRLVNLLNYDPVRNRGVKMKAKMKTRIRFELPGSRIAATGFSLNYTSVPAPPTQNQDKPAQTNYNYTINLD